ncbi:YusG family protein [Bacillus sp. FJAT-18017]|uniref:YusG family protein n=1 Tax=Bacillus sp. FJAT-18017 TaxID=1705566 RepID=UPI000AD34E64|nr:YusG family protein [Bacillus sp. FJAT-18017]
MIILALQEQKLDITDRVVGKLNNGEIKLYLENEEIGRIALNGMAEFELDKRFEVAQQRIYQNVTMLSDPDEKYTDCDQLGWC